MRMITILVIPLLLSGLSSTAEQGTHNSLVVGSNPSGRIWWSVGLPSVCVLTFSQPQDSSAIDHQYFYKGNRHELGSYTRILLGSDCTIVGIFEDSWPNSFYRPRCVFYIVVVWAWCPGYTVV